MSNQSNNSKKKIHPQPLQNVKVVVRIRPISRQEEDQNVKNIVKCHTHREMFLKEKKYTFDRVFKPTASQIELYMNVVAPLIQDVVEGYNCTAFAYGQTGTGKTYTMTGETCRVVGNWKEDEYAGIIPRAAFHIFDELNKMSNVDMSVKVSYIELYNEEIRDLLSDDENTLQIYTDNKGSVSIQGVNEISTHDGEGICKLFQRGIVKRQIAPTLMNHQSSRSHTVFTITVVTRESTPSGDDILKAGKINLVDLAGNENIARSGCKDLRATELANINRSLLTLGRVIHALVDKSQKHVPYRDSKLTRILQDSLGGHTKTVIIATVSPAHNSYEETTSTLDYATRARDIKNTPTINEKMTKHQIIDGLVKEIDRLQKDLDAARSGTGFYVDKENYQKMLDAISAVTGETISADELTARKAERIKNLEDLMYAKLRQFEETVEQCKKHEQELETARATMKEQDENLEQEKFLSKWYENQTSEKLAEAQRFLNVTKTLHSEKQILLAKLEHQFSINVSNEMVTHKAVTEVTNMIDKFGCEETRKIKVSEEKVRDEFKKSVLDLHKDLSNSSSTIKELSEQCESRARKEKNGFSVKNCILTKTNDYLDAIRKKTLVFEGVLGEYEKQLNFLKLEVPKMAKIYRKNTEMFFDKTMTLVKTYDDEIKNDIIEAGNLKTLECLNDSEKQLKTSIEGKENIIAMLRQQIEDENATLYRIQKEKEDLMNTDKRVKDCISERMTHLKSLVLESSKDLNSSLQLPALIDIQGAEVQDLFVVVKEFEDKLNEIASFLDEKHEKITQCTIEEFSRSVSNTCKVIEKSLDEKVNGLIKNIDVMMGRSEVVESFTLFSNNIKQILYEQILDKNVKASHVGDTPVRQSTSYPSRIQDITPREALIEKFKKTMMQKLEEHTEDGCMENDLLLP
ncbi:unnamed protein product [Psylliodes chrysocephalus]|uniref:Kinesin-like protein n=1 Tax=Psylliodes chrysocephalus TaxID=3402493 RepID=A0A9P0CQC4_9CUCU|nr:unnamed protein product [Psylliodes chrysocephala]